jgi:RNA polymerase sigma-B factor
VGLLKAVERFDPARGAALSTYAVPTILGELRRHFRDATWSMRVSREIQERVMRVKRQTRLLANQLGRSPSVPELAADLGLTAEEVLEAMEAGSAYRAGSLDEHLERPDGDGDALVDVLGVEDERFALVEEAVTLTGALRVLDERTRRVLRLRFAEDMTQSEIAAAIGVSQMHVSRLLRHAILALRDQTGAEAAA